MERDAHRGRNRPRKREIGHLNGRRSKQQSCMDGQTMADGIFVLRVPRATRLRTFNHERNSGDHHAAIHNIYYVRMLLRSMADDEDTDANLRHVANKRSRTIYDESI